MRNDGDGAYFRDFQRRFSYCGYGVSPAALRKNNPSEYDSDNRPARAHYSEGETMRPEGATSGLIFEDELELVRICEAMSWKHIYDEKNRLGVLSCGLFFRIARDLKTGQ